ncbi:MAG TPA: FAD-dependent oxidoreductase [Actinomycetota bacterium]|nr:FAD-dependent oxidoreductase [Actinomycetota bacterium]
MSRVLVVGGGYVGMYAALGLERRLAARGDELVLVSPESFMQYQPFLPEVASGNIEPRHVVVSLRQVLRRTRLLVGEVELLDHPARVARVRTADGALRDLPYDVVVLGPGSRSRVLPIPGLRERGVGFKTVAEAIYLRNRLLSRMDVAASAADPEVRRAALTFVFVGGGYAGVEALAELEDLGRAALRFYPGLGPGDLRFVLVEAGDRILGELSPALAEHVRRLLEARGVEVALGTRLASAEGGVIRLSDGRGFRADTLVWTAGVRPHPLAARSGFPVDDAGRVLVDEFLRVRGLEGAWAAGDAAAVPDLTTGGLCPPTAQHALRQARRLARNVLAVLEGRPPTPFRYRNLGQLASLGRYRGVAEVLGLRLRGFPAWWLHRSYHLLMMPTLNRKVRIALDWTVGLLFPRDVVQLGSLHHPREAFERAAEE